MIDSGKRYCDRCGRTLTRDNNKCGYEVCDNCNEYLERVKAEKLSDRNMKMIQIRKAERNETDG